MSLERGNATSPLLANQFDPALEIKHAERKERETKRSDTPEVKIETMNEWKEAGRKKTGGSGAFNQRHSQETDGATRYSFIKWDPVIAKNIVEVFIGRLMRRLNKRFGDKGAPTFPDSIAEVDFVLDSKEHENPSSLLPDNTGKNVNIRSMQIKSREKYQALWQYLFERNGKATDGERPKQAGTDTEIHSLMRKELVDNPNNILNLSLLLVLSTIFDNFDAHIENVGVVDDMIASLIDFGGAAGLVKAGKNLRPFDGKLQEEKEFVPGVGPTNHIKEFPRELRYNKESAKFWEIFANLSAEELAEDIAEACHDFTKFLGPYPLKQFFHWIGYNYDPNTEDTEELMNGFKQHFLAKLRERQEDAKKRLLPKIKLGLCFKRVNPKNPKEGYIFAEENIKTNFSIISVVREYPEYFRNEKFEFKAEKGQENFTDEMNAKTKSLALALLELDRIVEELKKYKSDSPTRKIARPDDLKSATMALTNFKDEFEKLPQQIKGSLVNLENDFVALHGTLITNAQQKPLNNFKEKLIEATAHLKKLRIEFETPARSRFYLLERIYNPDGKYSSWKQALVGWQRLGTTKEKIANLIAFGLPKIPIQILKIGTEVIPAAIAKLARMGWNKTCVNLVPSIKSPGSFLFWLFVRLPLGGSTAIACGSIYLAAKLTHEIGRRATSPVKAFKDSYKWGKQKGGRGLGCVCAALSAIVSIAVIPAVCLGLAIAAVPTAIGIAGVSTGAAVTSALTTASSWFAGLPVFGAISTFMGAKLAAVATAVSLPSSLVSATSVFASAVGTALTFCAGIAGIIKRACKKSPAILIPNMAKSTSDPALAPVSEQGSYEPPEIKANPLEGPLLTGRHSSDSKVEESKRRNSASLGGNTADIENKLGSTRITVTTAASEPEIKPHKSSRTLSLRSRGEYIPPSLSFINTLPHREESKPTPRPGSPRNLNRERVYSVPARKAYAKP